MIPSKYIEVIGLPGAGKSTVAAMLVKQYDRHNIKSSRRAPLQNGVIKKISILFQVFVLVLRSPILLRILFCPVKKEYRSLRHIFSVTRNLRTRLLIESVIVRNILTNSTGIFVNDEGIVGRVVALSVLLAIDEKTVPDILQKLLPRNTTILYIDVDSYLATRRMLSRGVSLVFLNNMGEETLVHFYEQNMLAYKKIVQNPVLFEIRTITNNGTPEDLEEITSREVRNVIRDTPSL